MWENDTEVNAERIYNPERVVVDIRDNSYILSEKEAEALKTELSICGVTNHNR